MNPDQDQFGDHRPKVTFSLKDDIGGHQVLAHKEGHGVVGRLAWAGSDGEISEIKVHPDHRRQGIATALLSEGRRLAEENKISIPQHSSERTKAGDAWAKSTKESLPEKVRPGSNRESA